MIGCTPCNKGAAPPGTISDRPGVPEVPTQRLWTRERISLATGYEEGRFNVQLFLPATDHAPYQVILFLPHAGHLRYSKSSDEYNPTETNQPLDFILKSGRAFAIIAFDDSFGRRWPDSRRDATARADCYRLHLVHHRQDLGRTLDYRETREDIDAGRIGWLGISLGSQAMMPPLAVEPRIGAAVLIGCGMAILGLPPV